MEEIMEKEKIREIVKGIINGVHQGCLATVSEGKPWVRYVMTSNIDDSLNLFTTTSLKSRKIQQIKENPHVHLTLGWDDPDRPSPYVQFAAEAIIHTDEETRKNLWTPIMEQLFKTPDNPDYCVLEFKPSYIEVWGYGQDMLRFLTYENK